MDTNNPQRTYHPPETKTQQVLADVWERILDVKKIGIDDNFVDAGGNSLLALQAYDNIRLHYQREFPLFDLSCAPTVRNMATIIDQTLASPPKKEYRTLRKIQQGEAGITPLFLVHGGDGNARLFLTLAKHLDSRLPTYAFRWSGWDGRRGDKSLRAMAQTYVTEMLAFRPTGAFRIGGYCVGGMIALEVAQMLLAAGREVEGPVFIWDSPNLKAKSFRFREPWYFPADYRAFKRMAESLNEFKKELKEESAPIHLPTQFSGSYELLRRFPTFYSWIRGAQVFLLVLPARLQLWTGKPIPIRSRWTYCMATCYFAVKRYVGKDQYNGPVVYFRSDIILGRTMNLSGWWDDPFLGFGELCSGTFQGYAVGGDHIDVLSRPEGATIVNQICFKED